MVDELSLGRGLVLLLAAVPLLIAGGRAAARLAVPSCATAAAAGPVLGLAAWLASVHVAALLAGSLVAGAVAGTAVAAAVALGAMAAARRAAPAADEPAADEPAADEPAPRFAAAAAAAFALAILALGSLGSFFDELGNTQHWTITLQMLQDVYPPRHLAFPDHELRYHYGFDLLAALVAATTRMPLWWAIDVATALGAGLAAFTLWRLGEVIVGGGRGALVAALTLGGGSTFFWIGIAAGLPWGHANLVLMTTPFLVHQNPPLVAYLFQHPWSLGIPIFAAVALLVAEARRARPLALGLALAVLLVAAALAQIVVYATVSGALLVAALALARAPATRRVAVAIVAADLVAFLCARSLGGFFAPSAAPLDLQLGLGRGVPWRGDLLFHLAAFGLPLVLALLGLRRSRPGLPALLFLATLVAGSLATFHLVRYGKTWDMVKLATMASLALGVLAAAGVAWMLERPSAGWRRAAVASLVLTLVPAVAWAGGRVSLMLAEGQARPAAPGGDDRAAIEWLLAHAGRRDVIYRREAAVPAYGYWAGLPNTGVDASVRGFPLPAADVELRERIETGGFSLAEARRSGVRFVVVEPAREPALARRAARWTERGQAVERARFGGLVVLDLRPAGE